MVTRYWDMLWSKRKVVEVNMCAIVCFALKFMGLYMDIYGYGYIYITNYILLNIYNYILPHIYLLLPSSQYIINK